MNRARTRLERAIKNKRLAKTLRLSLPSIFVSLSVLNLSSFIEAANKRADKMRKPRPTYPDHVAITVQSPNITDKIATNIKTEIPINNDLSIISPFLSVFKDTRKPSFPL
jgi:hypothetical protein